MKTIIEITLQPFPVPNDVTVEGRMPGEASHRFPLSVIDSATLNKMCDEFRKEVFKRAGKSTACPEF